MFFSRLVDKYRQMFMSFATTQVVRFHANKIHCDIRETVLRQNILNATAPGVTDREYIPGKKVIVSLTSFGTRVEWCGPAIESIMEQTCKANRIILWLGHDFKAPHMIPQDLRMLEKRGLEIRFTDDIGPATKLIPALKEFPEDIIITIDDDSIYSYNLIDKLLRGHFRYPGAIVADWQDELFLDDESRIRYRYISIHDTPHISSAPSLQPLALGCAGILYPPHSMHPDVMDVSLYKRLAPKADDLWFKIMQLRVKTPVLCVGETHPELNRRIAMEHHDQNLSLHRYNIHQNGNDIQLAALFAEYPCALEAYR